MRSSPIARRSSSETLEQVNQISSAAKPAFRARKISPGEIFLARSARFAADEIWFTCSNVSDDDLRAIGDERIVINLNSMSEVDRILALGLPNPVALRVNPDVGAGHHADVVTAGGGVKFGIDLAEVEVGLHSPIIAYAQPL